MAVYVISFALTILAIYWAKYYYKRYISVHGITVATFRDAIEREKYFSALAPVLCYDKKVEKRFYRKYVLFFVCAVMPLFLVAALRIICIPISRAFIKLWAGIWNIPNLVLTS